MPTGRRSNARSQTPDISDGDFQELQAALAGTLSKVAVSEFPPAEWALLALRCIRKGYTLSLSPQVDGRAVRLRIPIGQKPLEITAGNDQELVEAVRAMLMAVEKLPTR